MNDMFKQPDLSEETELVEGSDGFEDVTHETIDDDMDTEETTETKESTEKAEDTKPADEVTESPKYKLKYNHEEKEVTLEELTTLGQKGMNYDKLQEKFNEIQSNPALSKYSKVQEVSELLGYQSDDELLDALYSTYYERAAESQGLTPQQIQKDYELTKKEKAVAEKELTFTQKEKETEMYAKFAENYSGVTAEMIKPETWEKVNSGIDLTAAYTMQKNQELQEELKILKQNEQNAKKAPIGGVSTHGSGSTAHDDFLDGFDED